MYIVFALSYNGHRLILSYVDIYQQDEALSHVSDEEKEDVNIETERANTEGNDEESVEILQQKAQFQKNKVLFDLINIFILCEISSDYNSYNSYYLQGNELFKIGKYEEAIKCYACGIEADPWNAILYANRAMALLKLKRFARLIYQRNYITIQSTKYIRHYRNACSYMHIRVCIYMKSK